jgi:hypothetical protein
VAIPFIKERVGCPILIVQKSGSLGSVDVYLFAMMLDGALILGPHNATTTILPWTALVYTVPMVLAVNWSLRFFG